MNIEFWSILLVFILAVLCCILMVIVILIFLKQQRQIAENKKVSNRAEGSIMFVENKLDGVVEELSNLHPKHFYHVSTHQKKNKEEKK